METEEKLKSLYNNKTNPAKILIDAYSIAELINDDNIEIDLYENNKKDIVSKGLTFECCPNAIQKLDLELVRKRKNVLKLEEGLRKLELEFATAINSKLDYNNELDNMLKNPDEFATSDDKLTLIKAQIRELHSAFLKKEEAKATKEIKEEPVLSDTLSATETESWIARQQPAAELLLNKAANRIVGNMYGRDEQDEKKCSSNVEKSVAKLTEEMFRNYLGQQLVEQAVLGKEHSFIYPGGNKSRQATDPLRAKNTTATNKVNKNTYHQNKINNSLLRIAKMEKEMDKFTLHYQEHRKAELISKTLSNIDYIDKVTRNHQTIMEFLNTPSNKSTERYPQTIDDEHFAKNIPLRISLYDQDPRLSSALATCIYQKTKDGYFSDIEKRLKALEDKM